MTYQEWLEQKYIEWEKSQSSRQSYYNFARYLDVNHTALAQWMSGVNKPQGDDLAKVAGKLGTEIYALVGVILPSAQFQSLDGVILPSAQFQSLVGAYNQLPAALRGRLANAILEAGQQIGQRSLASESEEAKRLTVKVFENWGFRITG